LKIELGGDGGETIERKSDEKSVRGEIDAQKIDRVLEEISRYSMKVQRFF